MIDFDGKFYFAVNRLIEKNNIITGSKNIFFSNVNVKPCRFDKMDMSKDLIEHTFC